MILSAAADGIDLERSFMVGDRKSDFRKLCGIEAILIHPYAVARWRTAR